MLDKRQKPLGQPYIILSDKGDEIRHVKAIPIQRSNGETGFHRLRFPCYSVHVADRRETDPRLKYTLVWTPYGFNVTFPREQVRASKNKINYELKLGSAHKSGSVSYREFSDWVVAEFGKEMGLYILNLFCEHEDLQPIFDKLKIGTITEVRKAAAVS